MSPSRVFVNVDRDYIAEFYWPQGKSKKEGTRVTGDMIHKMYRKMEEKETGAAKVKAEVGAGGAAREGKTDENITAVKKTESPAVPIKAESVSAHLTSTTTLPATTAAQAVKTEHDDDEAEDGEIRDEPRKVPVV